MVFNHLEKHHKSNNSVAHSSITYISINNDKQSIVLFTNLSFYLCTKQDYHAQISYTNKRPDGR